LDTSFVHSVYFLSWLDGKLSFDVARALRSVAVLPDGWSGWYCAPLSCGEQMRQHQHACNSQCCSTY
jgi:hypothetical protein